VKKHKIELRGLLTACVALGIALGLTSMASAQDAAAFGGGELVQAANKEGKVVVYTANQLESEQALAKQFEKRFPKISVEVVRAPGSQLFTRVQTEAAAGKLGADVIEMSDRGLAKKIEDLFADYAPPNADRYPKDYAVSDKLWPKTSWAYVLAYNPQIVDTPPTNWAELVKPDFKPQLGILPAGSGGTPWTLAMFQRKKFGESYWKDYAAKKPQLYPSDSPMASGLVRGEVEVAPLKSNTIIPLMQQGAPIQIVYPTDGIAVTPSAAGVAKAAKHPNAAKLYLNWALSDEGQKAWVEGSGGVSVMSGDGPLPEGAKAADMKAAWVPPVDEYASLRSQWVKEWNAIFDYRQ
jgi:iron(III) transport system substrate-binding protein